MNCPFVAFYGKVFTIEWYFSARGKSVSLEYFEALSRDRQKKFVNLLRLLGDSGKVLNIEKFRYEGDQIYALKASEDRFLCFFFDGSKIIITNAYEKKSSKMPIREKERALKAKDDYTTRCKERVYYE